MDSKTTPTQQVSKWLSNFSKALETKDISAALEMFADDCYWRDLVSFTWNLKTLEDKKQIGAMLKSTLTKVKPSNWKLEGEATEAGGVTEGWFTFETKVARGKGHIRIQNGKCWTLLTTMTELKGFEEKKGPTRPKGVEHGFIKNKRIGSSAKPKKKLNWVIRLNLTA